MSKFNLIMKGIFAFASIMFMLMSIYFQMKGQTDKAILDMCWAIINYLWLRLGE